jgi:ferredoxin-NADP reductase
MNAPDAIAATSLITLRSREDIAAGTVAFHFAKPVGFTFKAGQAVELLLPDPERGKDMGHAFSLVSAPFEDELVIATRMRDSTYKRALGALAPGQGVRLDGPFGSLTLHKARGRPAVFVAGGIGITPFMSMLRQNAHDGGDRDVVLLYSNRGPGDAAFLAELQALARADRRFKLVSVMTETEGVLDAARVRQAVGDLHAPIAYVAGPPAMVEAMRTALAQADIDEDDIRSEDFFGY